MMKTIILKFSGPLQSWGIGSYFETRDTARYPTKSAVLGLVGATLGYRRDETEKINKLNDLSFGVRIEQVGTLLKDYHIAISPRQTYVTNRYYLQDAAFLAMISHEDSSLVDTLAKALVCPVFAPYMGRRSAPVGSDFFQGVIEDDILSTIKTYPWQASMWYKERLLRDRRYDRIVLNAYMDAYLLDDSSPSMLQRDKVDSFDPMNRNHGFRTVKSIQVEIQDSCVDKDTEHDVFQEIGGV